MINNEYMYTLATRIRGASIVTLREDNTCHFGWRIGEETMLGCWVEEMLSLLCTNNTVLMKSLQHIILG